MSFVFARGLMAADAPQQPDALTQLLANIAPIILILVVFYFLMLRPQRRAQQQKDALLSKLKKNDRVVTIGGIVGTVVQVTDREVTLKIDDNTRMKMLRSSISDMYQPDKQDGSSGGAGDAKS